MFRPASRALLRAPAFAVRGPVTRRFISTAQPQEKSRSWKSTAARLGLAIGAVYYYNTSSVFAQEPSFSFRPQPQADVIDESSLPTLDTIKPKVRAKPEEPSQSEVAAAAATATQPDDLADVNTAAASKDVQVSEGGLASAEELESEASQEAAFNPETGEINWDCPCLGGMAHGPCGEEFKAAFSCFVYSNEEPKGIDCIEKFKGMQDCFRQYPDVYGAELEDDEPEPAEGEPAPSAAEPAEQTEPSSPANDAHARAKEAHDQLKAEKGDHAESEELVPKAHHSAEDKSTAEKTEK
ncbi:Oxidoreductase [Monascus purpureus]|uniref:Mitochondrial intermembrane space import and assembly protein 40 n=1 Tax=Monascus purpureus TaxID=5098 RepID=A0A507R4P9_MONPU|nr:Oxidoreductase [Monascus purpureus]BDD59211.1 Oxidoreductase [Monascus purpureus]